jgi:hypothetical protein
MDPISAALDKFIVHAQNKRNQGVRPVEQTQEVNNVKIDAALDKFIQSL